MKVIHGTRGSRVSRRRGITIIECAFVYPIMLMLTIGVIILSLGVFRYQQVALLAREGARWAAVHGSTYQKEQNKSAPTSNDVVTNAVNPRMVGLDPSQLTCTLNMQASTVSVTMSYVWVPEGIVSGPITMTSTSTLPITY